MIPVNQLTYFDMIRIIRTNLDKLINQSLIPILEDENISESAKEAIMVDFWGLQLHLQAVAKSICAIVEHQELLENEANN